MTKYNKKLARTLLRMLAAAGLLTLLIASGLLKRIDLTLSDTLYQRRSASDGKIVIVGIDQRALEEIGPYNQWGRDVIARAIDALNAAENRRPAVIALDILYAGETDAVSDSLLAKTAGKYGNVLTACAAEFGNTLEAETKVSQ